MKIKVGDKVLVACGKDKGKVGKVQKVFKKNNRGVVEKVNIRTKHIKKTVNRPGERIKYEAPVDLSNLKLICPSCSKAVRVAYEVPEQGKKYRVCKKCNSSVEVASATKKKK